jgi:hypothetical protein
MNVTVEKISCGQRTESEREREHACHERRNISEAGADKNKPPATVDKKQRGKEASRVPALAQPHHVNVVETLGAVEEHIARVVADEDEHTDAVVAHLVGPTKQDHGDNVVEKHHPVEKKGVLKAQKDTKRLTGCMGSKSA